MLVDAPLVEGAVAAAVVAATGADLDAVRAAAEEARDVPGFSSRRPPAQRSRRRRLSSPLTCMPAPPGALVKLTATFESTVEITSGARTANARGVLA